MHDLWISVCATSVFLPFGLLRRSGMHDPKVRFSDDDCSHDEAPACCNDAADIQRKTEIQNESLEKSNETLYLSY